MISVKNINKSYGEIKVLKDVSIDFQSKKITAITGKSGAGKSTLLHIIGTLDKPDSGKLMLNNESVFELSNNKLSEFRNLHLGFIFQFHHLLPEFNALENVCIPGYIANKKSSFVEKKAKELLGFLGLSNRLTHKPKELSGGEAQRVAFARALINDPELILADEPTGNLDEKTAEDLHNLIFKLRDLNQQTFIIITHNRSFAKICDHMVVMENGAIKEIF